MKKTRLLVNVACVTISHKSRHLKIKTHIKGLEDKKVQEQQIEIDDKNDKFKVHIKICKTFSYIKLNIFNYY